ncbi:MAG: phosphatidylserine decarboxylase family protein [Bacteroidota bacterium]
MINLIHKEGRMLLLVTAIVLIAVNYALAQTSPILFWLFLIFSVVVFGLFLQFFRNPPRKIAVFDNKLVYAPADGKVCVIETVYEGEYFKDQRIQISIFMSPLNVHVNRNPVSGIISYFKYHPGKYLVAWHPKSSTENERNTTVYRTENGTEILMRQIAGAVARRIRWYIGEGSAVKQGEDMGFIKFGSRVDLYLPLDAKIEVTMDEIVQGNKTIVAKI